MTFKVITWVTLRLKCLDIDFVVLKGPLNLTQLADFGRESRHDVVVGSLTILT